MTFADRLAELTARIRAWLRGLSASKGAPALSTERRADLVDFLDKGQPGQRWLAAEALGEGDPGQDGLAALQRALASQDPILRREAGDALARIGSRKVRRVLLESAAAHDPLVQAAAVDGLGGLPADEETAALLAQLLDSPYVATRLSAAEALARAGLPPGRGKAGIVVDPGPRLLHLLASDADPMVRRAAALALGRLGEPSAADALAARIADEAEDWRVREAAVRAVSRLHPAAPQPEEQGVEAGMTTNALAEEGE